MQVSAAGGKKPTPHHAVARLASAQGGLITVAQLRAIGVNDRTAASWVARGALHRVHRGVYAVGHTALTVNARRRAALLAVRPDAALCLWTAAAQLGLTRRVPEVVHVAVPSGRLLNRTGIRVHHMRSLRPADLTVVDGLPSTTAARTLVDLAARKDCTNLERLCEQAEFMGLLDVEAIEATIRRLGAPPGSRRLRSALGATSLGTSEAGSKTERRVLRALLRAGVERPVLQRRFELPRAGRVFVDLCWPDRRLIVEVDGPQHGLPLQKAKDDVRDADLQALGWRVLRVRTRDFDADAASQVARIASAVQVSAAGGKKHTPHR